MALLLCPPPPSPVIHCVRCVVDIGNCQADRGRVCAAPSAIADGVGEAVRTKVVGVRRIADAAAREAGRAVVGRRHSDHRQAGVERGTQVVGIGVVGQHVDGVVADVFRHRRLSSTATGASLTLVTVRLTVAVSCGRHHRTVVADGVGEAVRAEVVGAGV